MWTGAQWCLVKGGIALIQLCICPWVCVCPAGLVAIFALWAHCWRWCNGRAFLYVLTMCVCWMWKFPGGASSLKLHCGNWPLELFWQLLWCLLSSNTCATEKKYVFFCTCDSGCTHCISFLSRAGWTVPHGHCVLTACSGLCFIPVERWSSDDMLGFKVV